MIEMLLKKGAEIDIPTEVSCKEREKREKREKERRITFHFRRDSLL